MSHEPMTDERLQFFEATAGDWLSELSHEIRHLSEENAEMLKQIHTMADEFDKEMKHLREENERLKDEMDNAEKEQLRIYDEVVIPFEAENKRARELLERAVSHTSDRHGWREKSIPASLLRGEIRVFLDGEKP